MFKVVVLRPAGNYPMAGNLHPVHGATGPIANLGHTAVAQAVAQTTATAHSSLLLTLVAAVLLLLALRSMARIASNRVVKELVGLALWGVLTVALLVGAVIAMIVSVVPHR